MFSLRSFFKKYFSKRKENYLIGTMSAMPTPPDDTWKICDGAELNRFEYADLFRSIGYSYGGSGDYFALPDMRDPTGRFGDFIIKVKT